MCALLGLVVPLHLFGRTYQRMSIGNIPTFEKLEEIANQTRPGMSVLEWLQGFNDKIRSADELALVICGIKQIWGWANRKNRKKNINLEMFPSKVHLVMLYSAEQCHVFSSQKQRQVRRELGKAPFSKQAIQILRPIYKKNIEDKKVRWPGKIHASDQDKYLAMRTLQTGDARITTLTQARVIPKSNRICRLGHSQIATCPKRRTRTTRTGRIGPSHHRLMSEQSTARSALCSNTSQKLFFTMFFYSVMSHISFEECISFTNG